MNDDQELRRTTATLPSDPKMVRRVALSSFVGTFIEFYDYFIYGASAALVFPHLFFSNMSPTTASIVSFATLGVTFLTRPIGAVLFGHYGDTRSRKKMLVLSLVVMGLATFAIGLLPSYSAVGALAPVLLVTIRLLQGVAIGGEWGGATTMIIEYAPQHRRGLYGSFVQLGNVVGLLVSTGAFASASALDRSAFLAWGWRLPFLASVVLLGVGIFIRLRVAEPPAFERLRAERRQAAQPLLVVLRTYPKQVLVVIGLRLSENVLGYLIISWVLSYATVHLGLTRVTALEGVMLAAASGIVTFPLYGWLSDVVGRRPVYLWGAVTASIFAFPFFFLLDTRSPGLLQLALVIGYGGVLAAMYALEPSYFSELFETAVRYTGVSVGCQLASVVGGFTPLAAAALMAWSGGRSWPVAVMLLIASLTTAVSVLAAGETFRRKIVIQ